MFNQLVDTCFLMGQVNELVSKHDELKRQLFAKGKTLENLKSLIRESESKINFLTSEKSRLFAEIQHFEQSKKDSICEIEHFEQSKKDSICELNDSIAKLQTLKTDKLIEIDLEVKKYSEELRSKALIALRSLVESAKVEEVSKLTKDLEHIKKDLLIKGQALEQAYREKSEALENEHLERIAVIEDDLKIQFEKLELFRTTYKNEKYRLITEAKEVIDLERQRLEIQNKEELNRIEETRLRTQAEISQNKMVMIKAFEPQIIAPYQVRIEELESEVVRLNKVMASNSKKSYAWQLEQVKAVITKQRGEYLEPVHLRIAGESESGKSHLVNQLIATGLNHFGVNCDFELYDPYPSDSQWSMTPYISEDPEKVLDRLTYWTEFVESKDSVKLSKPLILICDEGDEMIRTYKAHFVNCVKALWKRGRHVNLFLWLLGQNGNVKPLSPLDWSDLKNASQIYLNQVCYDYLKNGLGSRDTKALQGELDHVASLSEYIAIVQPKTGKAYPVTIPPKLFEGETLKPENVVTPGNKLICPKCNSEDVKKNGFLNNRPRIKCNSCLKQSYAD